MSSILTSLQGVLGNVTGTFWKVLDRIFPPEQRAEVLAKLQSFAASNPKLAAFLTTQIVITGLPLLLFATFTLTIFLFSLVVALILGLLAAVLFTVFMVVVALIVVLPTVFMSIFAASFLFLWGLGGYYVLKWINEGDAPAEQGKAIGDKLNSWSGGRMSWLMDGARKKQEDKAAAAEQTMNGHASEKENGSSDDKNSSNAKDEGPKKLDHAKDEGTKNSSNAKDEGPKKLNHAKDEGTKQADGVTKRATKNTGSDAAKGTASGATGQG